MPSNNGKKESKVEAAKKKSKLLRGKIAETLASEATHFEHDDTQVLKFHGVYQQDDRDVRRERKQAGQEADYSFMVRVALPGGLLSGDQYLSLDRIADDYANGTLRITTRQGIQFHGVYKKDLKSTIAGINQRLMTTLSACGDVERNVMACPAPLGDAAHVLLQETAREIAVQLRPASRAYHEIWLDEEKVVSTLEKEPFYGDQYLPRKFKTGIALDSDNCIDVYSYDCGLVAVLKDGRIQGYQVLIGGGMGMSHGKADTFARLAEPMGYIGPEHAVETVRTVAAVFRDHGNRADRKHARLKYLLEEWGIDRFREEFRQRVDFELAPPVSLPTPEFHDHLGRNEQGDGKWFYGIFVENGRIADRDGCRLKSALRSIIETHRPGVRLTSSQNLLLTDLDESALVEIEKGLTDHGVAFVGELSAARRYSMACPALPTCGLAITESERVMPSVVDRIEAELERLGLSDVPLTLRMTGCPNGCARPYTADIAFVGRKPGEQYNVYVGGGLAGDRVADLLAEDVPVDELVAAIRPLLERWAGQRRDGEGLSDFYQRLFPRELPRMKITGAEEPTQGRISLEVLR
ncbi:MAG: NADPH-dependent assimilatory sulfite reductase hemoprotein subunit [Phycisphaerales bacterium]|nr:NADPH-dependent assimilatory sulfite reductase hemoprotein subunit [Phycisphaerales bacterium]